MSILETRKVDMVAARPDSSVVKLVIADHLDWSEPERHCKLLQDKINTYILFVESGQLLRLDKPSVPPSPEIHIVLVAEHGSVRPDVAEFFSRIERFLDDIGMKFDVEMVASSP